MITLENIDKSIKFKCQIVGYQFPNAKNDDANWCLLEVDITDGEKTFHKIDPAIETQDLVDLHDWFYCLSTNTLPKFAHLQFIEPCISFEFLAKRNDTVRFSIHLNHELRPNFNICNLESENTDLSIVFEINKSGFEKLLLDLKDTIKQFPAR